MGVTNTEMGLRRLALFAPPSSGYGASYIRCPRCDESVTMPSEVTSAWQATIACRCDRIADWIKDNRWAPGKGI